MSSLLKQLLAYKEEDYYPMHMPGHKRNTKILKGFDPYEIDITEIDGFDNLHHASGVIADLQEKVRRQYGADHSYLLINGSTVGILAGISACVKKGDRILMARNCHKAVYNAVILNELDPVYIYPQKEGVYGIHGGILPEKIEEMLITDPKIKLVVITSPTYEGIVSDVKQIVEISHKYQVPVLVDEAHGAHLGMHKKLPKNSVYAGADLVIHSIHKTLPAFTQTAVMHVNGTLVSEKEVEKYLGIYETSSPSYVLMAGIDQCMDLLETKGEELFQTYLDNLEEFYSQMQGLQHLKIMRASDYEDTKKAEHGIEAIDPSKIVISVKNTNITGNELANRLLHTYKIQLEMSSIDYALAMTSICDTKEGLERLKDALYEIDGTLGFNEKNDYEKVKIQKIDKKTGSNQERIEKRMIPYEAIHQESEEIPFVCAVGRVASNHIMVYPPGIPVVVAGEVIKEQSIQEICEAYNRGLEVLGLTCDQNTRTCETQADSLRVRVVVQE